MVRPRGRIGWAITEMNTEQIIPCVVGGCDLAKWPHRLPWPDQTGPMCYFKIPEECRHEKIVCPIPCPVWWRACAPVQVRITGVPAPPPDFARALAKIERGRFDFKQRASEPREPGEDG